MSYVDYDPATKTWVPHASGQQIATPDKQAAEDWLDLAENRERQPSWWWRLTTNMLLWVYWTLVMATMVVMAPVVILYSLMFDPD